MSNVKSARIIQPITLETVPKGIYAGVWSGYEVTVIIHEEIFQFQTIEGIRGTDVKCIVHVKDDSVSVEVQK